MKHYAGVIFLLVLALGLPTPASAVIISSNPTLTISQEGVNYPAFGGSDLPTVIVQKTFNSLEPIGTTITYEPGDLQGFGGGGLRWFERITNNSGVAWTDFHITLSGATFYIETCCGGLPNQATSDFDAGNPSDLVTTITLQSNPPVISSGNTVLDFYFGTPIGGAGGIIELHLPIASLNASGGSFELTQTPTVVPEPSTLLLLGFGLVGLGRAAWRRRP
jgi:hypothetical protein